MAIGRVMKRDGAQRRIVVVGAGFSGVAVTAQLLRHSGAYVTLIERDRRFGLGLAYGAAAAGGHLLNTPAARMSALDDAPADFADWLSAHGWGDGASFATRARYGAYLEHTLKLAAGAWPHRALTRVRGAVVACRREADGWRLTLQSGRTIAADAVVLALGHPPSAIPALFAAEDLISPWDRRALKRLPKGRNVLLLGTGLTMADVALDLAHASRKGVIYALSRRGRIPHAHAPSGEPQAEDLPLELSGALHQFRKRAGDDWRGALNALRPITPALWARLGPARQARFLRHLRPWWDSHRHRAPAESAARLARLIEAGRVRVLAGDVVGVERLHGGWRVQHRQRGSHVRHRIEVSGMVNCIGPGHDISGWDDPLIQQLLGEGLARAPENKLGLDVDAENLLRDGSGVSQAGLYLIGPLALGAFWETTAAPELKSRAASIARAIG